MLTNATPDALMVPESHKRGTTMYDRLRSILAPAEKRLGVDRAKGERAWLRRQPDKRCFITKSTEDSIYFPATSPLRGQPRYRWIPQPDGTEHGFLVDEARAALSETIRP